MSEIFSLVNSAQSLFFGKTVLVTGHTGFKGSWLTCWLKKLGARVIGVSIDHVGPLSLFEVIDNSSEIVDLRIDIRDQNRVKQVLLDYQPDFVFHLAAQSLVQDSITNPIQTWQTNVLGTLNVLEGLRHVKHDCIAVLITSDKCYENVEWAWGYREIDRLGGSDPYSASKSAAELAITSYVRTYFPITSSRVRIASARAGNVIGGGDWANNRIIPDCVKSWSKNQAAIIRNPSSTRPWQHVLEPLSGYLTLSLELLNNSKLHGESFNFGPNSGESFSVLDLVEEMSKYWSQVTWEVDNSSLGTGKEAALLKLNCDKAASLLKWRASLNFAETIELTADWYKTYYQDSAKIILKTKEQIQIYENISRKSGLNWIP
jgi:CDP-glucose 4,6-dehydratase